MLRRYLKWEMASLTSNVAYNNLGVIYKDLDNLEKALQYYLAALTINPKVYII